MASWHLKNDERMLMMLMMMRKKRYKKRYPSPCAATLPRCLKVQDQSWVVRVLITRTSTLKGFFLSRLDASRWLSDFYKKMNPLV